jgi:hypothetical protein
VTLYIEASNPTAISYAYLPALISVSNFAPYFIDGPLSGANITIGETLIYQIPAFTDNEDQNVSLSLSGLDDTFMKFDEIAMTIQLTPVTAGNFTVGIILTDNLGAKSNAEVIFEVLDGV